MSRTFSRTPQACGTCRRRKTKCDGIRPRCKRCRSKNVPCVWSIPDVVYDPGPPLPLEVVSPIQNFGASPSSTISAPELEPKGLQICLDLFFERHFANDFCSFDLRPDFEQKCMQDPFIASSVVSLCGRYIYAEDAQTTFGLSSGQDISRCFIQKARSLAKATSDEPSGRFGQLYSLPLLQRLT